MQSPSVTFYLVDAEPILSAISCDEMRASTGN